MITREHHKQHRKQHRRRKNIGITGVLDTVQDNRFENKVTEICDATGVEAKSAHLEDCHRVGNSKNNSKKVISKFANRKIVKNALYKRKQSKSIDKKSVGFLNATIFLNESLTLENNKIAYHCQKLKRDGTISKTFTTNGTKTICCNILGNGNPQKVYYVNDLCVMFPDINFSNNYNDYAGDPANESLQSSY